MVRAGRAYLLVLVALFSAAVAVQAQGTSFEDVAKRIEARVSPGAVKRGEAVKWTLTLELAPGWHSYPTKQPDAKHESFVNKIKFANTDQVVFVGAIKEPKITERIEDGALLAEVEGTATWERMLVVRPDAKPGKVKLAIPVTIQVCDKNTCLPPKKIVVEVVLSISDGPAVAVDPKYQKDVDAAGKK